MTGRYSGKEGSMEPRINTRAANPALLDAMVALQQAVNASGLDESLIMLIDIRASQINGCGH